MQLHEMSMCYPDPIHPRAQEKVDLFLAWLQPLDLRQLNWAPTLPKLEIIVAKVGKASDFHKRPHWRSGRCDFFGVRPWSWNDFLSYRYFVLTTWDKGINFLCFLFQQFWLNSKHSSWVVNLQTIIWQSQEVHGDWVLGLGWTWDEGCGRDLKKPHQQ